MGRLGRAERRQDELVREAEERDGLAEAGETGERARELCTQRVAGGVSATVAGAGKTASPFVSLRRPTAESEASIVVG